MTRAEVDDRKQQEDEAAKFDYLKGKYIFRYPFTVTSVKWATIMGAFFGTHAFIKKRSIRPALEWGLWGTLLSVFPIWFFFMTKYTLYSYSVKKFEIEQLAAAEDSDLRKKLIQMQTKNDGEDEQELFKILTKKINSELLKNSELDFLLEGIDATSFDRP